MHAISESFTLLWEALFLQPRPYVAMRERHNPALKGLVILILLGLALALAGLVGQTLAWAATPDLAAIQAAVLRNLQQMDWWAFVEMDPVVEAVWFQVWESVWAIVGFLSPSPVSGLSGFLFRPLGLVVSWFVFGVVAHLIARLLGGSGRLVQTLGTTSIAAAPQLLGLFAIVPFAAFAGIGMWVVLTRYMAIRVTHDLTWGRATWVVLLSMLLIFLLQAFLISAGVIASASVVAATFGGA